MECIGKEFVRHEFRFTPARGKVVNIYRETYKCPECAISEEHPDDLTFVKAPVQEPLIPESYASESVVGWAMHQKYQNGLPLNRQEEDWKQLGVPLSRATLANWIIYCAENYLRHVYDYFHRQLWMRKYLMADETRVPDTAVFQIISVKMRSDHSRLAGRTGCSVPALKEPLLVLLCIQWLRWQKRMI